MSTSAGLLSIALKSFLLPEISNDNKGGRNENESKEKQNLKAA